MPENVPSGATIAFLVVVSCKKGLDFVDFPTPRGNIGPHDLDRPGGAQTGGLNASS
jgi:hypothetical protein